jgi:acyl-CoA thioesterase-1
MSMSRSWFLSIVLGVVLALGSSLEPASSAENSDVKEGKPVILVLGDSLSAGYGMAADSTWVALLRRKLDAEGYGYRVVNASVSGETTGGGRARLARALQVHRPAVLILELGGNDGLRGLPMKQVRSNLDTMIEQARKSGSEVLLVGMRMPPNYGSAYAEQFYSMYGELGAKHGIGVVPFFLDGVAQDAKLMQSDQIHPTAAAQPMLLENVWPSLEELLKTAK